MNRALLTIIALCVAALMAVEVYADTTVGPITSTGPQTKRGTSNVGAPQADRAACIQAARDDAESRKASANYSCNPRDNFRVTYTAPVVVPPPAPPPPPPAPPPPPPPAPPPSSGSYMPVVNTALIPAPTVGHANRRIGHTGEMPSKTGEGGDFRTACDYSHMNFDDPILFPGQQGRSHLHVFFGNTGADYRSTPTSILSSGNSTCRGGIVNRSSYWVPAMIDTRDGRPIRPRESGFYYKTVGLPPAQVKAFPPGFRMIAGDAQSENPQPRVYYGCNGENWRDYIPTCRTGETMEMTVNFPQCWNGVDLTAPDGRSHVAYAVDHGRSCPAGFPVMLPEVTILAIYPIANGSGADSSTWRLSSDNYPTTKPGGYSGHGDWFHGWDQTVMDTWVRLVLNRALDGHSHIIGDGRVIY